MVNILLESGADINKSYHAMHGGRMNALQLVTRDGNEQLARLLLEKGANVEGGDEGLTPLQAATVQGNVRLINLLLEKGARINGIGSGRGAENPPAWIAASRGHTEILGMLLEKGADTEYRQAQHTKTTHRQSRSALSEAVKAGHGGAVRLLLDAGREASMSDLWSL